MTDPSLTLPHRIAGNLALDLANTISRRGTPDEKDHLADIAGVLTWARAAGLIDDAAVFTSMERDTLFENVLQLRSAIDRAGAAIAEGRVVPPDALATIRDLASRSLAAASLSGAPVRLEFKGVDRILGPLSWSALDLLRGAELDRLKMCPPDDCRWLFIDRTKNGSRRWCEMATCGNRAKKEALAKKQSKEDVKPQ